MTGAWALGVGECAAALAAGQLSSAELVEECLQRIAARVRPGRSGQ